MPALASWIEVAAQLDPRPQAPEMARTWIELAGDMIDDPFAFELEQLAGRELVHLVLDDLLHRRDA